MADHEAAGKPHKTLREEWDEIVSLEAQWESFGQLLEERSVKFAARLAAEHEQGWSYTDLARDAGPGMSKSKVAEWVSAYHLYTDNPNVSFREHCQSVRYGKRTKEEHNSRLYRRQGQMALRNQPEALANEIAEALANPRVSDAVQAKIRRTPRLQAAIEANQARPKSQRTPYIPKRTREQIDAGIREHLPERRVSPWDPFWEAHKLNQTVFSRMHPDAWEEQPIEMVELIGKAATDDAKFLASVAAVAQDRLTQYKKSQEGVR